MKIIFDKKNGGFALLFSVLIASLLLTIGLSIFSIALKELAISTNAERSIISFYAADSGRECGLYWDIRTEKMPTVYLNNLPARSAPNIICGGISPVVVTKDPEAQIINESLKNTFNFPIITDGPKVEVTITKKLNPIGSGQICGLQGICTTITARGWDSAGDDRVERAIEENY